MTTPAVIVVTPEALAELVRSAVSEALAEARQDSAPVLLDRNGIAKALGIGLSTVDKFRRENMPCLMVGESPRFLLDECLAWLRENRGTR